jgi:hypothetical protein
LPTWDEWLFRIAAIVATTVGVLELWGRRPKRSPASSKTHRLRPWAKTVSVPLFVIALILTIVLGAVQVWERVGAPGANVVPAEVQSWCYTIPGGGTCNAFRFVQSPTAEGSTLPHEVLMKTGQPVAIRIPSGFTAQVYTCPGGETVRGPRDVPRVCTMTVWRGYGPRIQ